MADHLMSSFFPFSQWFLARLARLIVARPGAILLTTLFITSLAGYLTYANFSVINRLGAILNKNSATNRDYLAYKAEFNIDEEYVIVLRSLDPEKNRTVADILAKKIEAIGPGIQQVFYKLDFSTLEPRFLLYQSQEELETIQKEVAGYSQQMKKSKAKLNLNSMLDQANRSFNDSYLRQRDNWKEFEPFINRFVTMLNRLADALEHPSSSPLASQDPLTQSLPQAEVIEAQKTTEAGGFPTSSPSTASTTFDVQDIQNLLQKHEYLAYQDGKILLLLATPGLRESESTSPYTQTLRTLRTLLEETQEAYPDVSIGLTGEPVLNDDEMQTAAFDAAQASLITFVLIAVLFTLSYRERSRPFLAIGVLLLALIWSLAFTMVVIGHLNVITNAFVPMMLGLGIDFGIQILGRYEEALAQGRSILLALEEALQQTGTAVITSGTITAAAFYTMCFNDLAGLQELGAICGTAVIFCLIANLIVLPALFVWRDQNQSPEKLLERAKRSAWNLSPHFNQTFLRHPYLIITAGGLMTLLSLWGTPKILFDYNLLNLQNQELESVQIEHLLIQDIGNASIYATMAAPSLEKTRELAHQIEKLSTVKEVESLASILPENQEAKLPLIQSIVDSLQGIEIDPSVSDQVNASRTRRDLARLQKESQQAIQQASKYTALSEQARLAKTTFEQLIPPLDRALLAMQNLSQQELNQRLNRYQTEVFAPIKKNLSWLRQQKADRPIRLDDVPQALRDRFVGKTGQFLLQIYSKENIWEREPLVQFVTQLRTIDPHVTGTPVQNFAYIERLRTSYLEAAGWAFLVITLLILLHFRHLGYAALAILPLLIGVLWTLGIMGLTGLAFNPANIMTLPMVIGIGVAYGIYTVDRFREHHHMDLFSTSTGKSIILSALTTIFAFGSMLGSSYIGLKSMGQVMTLGVGMCLVTSILLLPQILSLTSSSTKPPSSPQP